MDAQNQYFPIGTFWNYDYISHDGGLGQSVTIRVTGDTIINNIPTRLITKFYKTTFAFPPHQFSQGSFDWGGLQIIGDTVLHYYANPNFAFFLFSFSMAVGDTVDVIDPWTGNNFATVDSQSIISINSHNLKKWELSRYCNEKLFSQVSIIEGIGQINDYLFWNIDGCIIGGGTHYFRCFSGGGIEYNEPCAPLSAESDNLQSKVYPVRVNPNPLRRPEKLAIVNSTTGTIQVTISNIHGRVVFHGSLPIGNNELTLDILPKGIYVYKALRNNQVVGMGKIVIQ